MTALLSAPLHAGRPQRRIAAGLEARQADESSPALPRPDHPWQARDLTTVWALNLVGLALLLGGLQGTRHTTDPERLVLLMNVAGLGLVLALAGNAVFLLAGLRQVGRLRTALLVRPGGERRDAPVVDATTSLPMVADPHPGTGTLVAAPAMTRFHLASCPAAAGKPVTAAPRSEHEAEGRQPCGMCRPTGTSEVSA